MPTPERAVSVTLDSEHWLRIERALHTEAILSETAGDTTEARRCSHTRQLICHVIERWGIEA
jgi:hypothetical protein